MLIIKQKKEVEKMEQKREKAEVKRKQRYYINCLSDYDCTKLLVPRNGTKERQRSQ